MNDADICRTGICEVIRFFLKLPANVEAGGVRQMNIKNNQRRDCMSFVDGFPAVSSIVALIARLPEHAGKDVPVLFPVIDYQNPMRAVVSHSVEQCRG